MGVACKAYCLCPFSIRLVADMDVCFKKLRVGHPAKKLYD